MPIPDPRDLKVIKQNTISQAKTIRKNCMYGMQLVWQWKGSLYGMSILPFSCREACDD